MQNLIQLISTYTGLQIREQDQIHFCNKISSRMKVLKLNTPQEYYQLLLSISKNSENFTDKNNRNEWKELLLLLTTGETYFFRDQGQLNLLKNKLIPELIANKIKTCELGGNKKPSLKIWSAGCSSGEEPYSLAIIVKELIPDLNEWNISILGTDINRESIAKAEKGMYDTWSFRQVNPQIQKQYFHQRKMRWEIDEQIRKMVKFRCMNLFQEAFPSQVTEIQNIDVIICRNVFIYFNSGAIATVLEKFYHTLTPGGYLIAGHAELHGQNLGKLQQKAFPESVVYHRSDLQVASTGVTNFSHANLLKQSFTQSDTTIKQKFPVQNLNNSNVALIRTQTQRRSPLLTDLAQSSESVLSWAKELFNSGEYTRAIQTAQQLLQQHPKHFEAHCLLAQAWANLGDYKQASDSCQQALQIDNLSEKPYYILAHIAEEKGDIEQAKALFKKIIYLAPSSVGAYLEISFLYTKEGDHNRAKKMLTTALDFLKNVSDIPIESYHQTPASELILQIEDMLTTI